MRKLARGHQPAARGIVPAGIDHLRAEIDVRVQALLHRDAALVVGDLRLRAEAARPVEVLRERQGVQVAGHVARRTRVGVVAPGPADLVAAVDDPEILDALAQQVGSGGEAGEARADDQDVGFLRGMVHGPNDSPRRAAVGAFSATGCQMPRMWKRPPRRQGPNAVTARPAGVGRRRPRRRRSRAGGRGGGGSLPIPPRAGWSPAPRCATAPTAAASHGRKDRCP